LRRTLAWTLSPAALLVAAAAHGQCANPVTGPDVIVGDIPDIVHHTTAGAVNGKRAYSFGTTSCNLGSQRLIWDDTTNVYPVISQNMYRVANGRFEQIGQSWLKHGFCALQGNVCCSCQPGGNCDALFPGCSDPYSAGLNGSQGGLGPKHEIDAAAGYIPLNWNNNGIVEPGDTNQIIYKRLQVAQADLTTASATYLFASSYVQPEDSEYHHDLNSQSYRRVTVNQTNFNVSLAGTTRRGISAIYAWQEHGLGLNLPDPNVFVNLVNDTSTPPHNNITIPGIADGGHYLVGAKVSDLGGGIWHYEYAIQNMTSDRSGGSFRVPLPAGAIITNAAFSGVPYHSGEPYSNTAWNIVWSPNATEIVFQSPQTFAQNPNSNALRWDTVYNFRFDCNVAPVAGNATIGLFKPAVVPATDPTSLIANTRIPNPAGGGNFIPPNNICANATSVAGGQTFFVTTNATTDGPDEPAACTNAGYTNIGSDVWYRWRSGVTPGTVTVSTCGSGFDTKMAVYPDSCPNTGGTTLACNDDSATCGTNSLQSNLTFTCVANTNYLIRIGGFQQGANPPATGTGTLTITPPDFVPPPPPPPPAPPSNDVCATSAAWIAAGSPQSGNTTAATNDSGGGTFCAASAASNDVWFKYRPLTTGNVTVDLCGSSYDTALAVRSGSCTGTIISCNDDSNSLACGALNSRLTVAMTAGTTYFIRVTGYQGAVGAYTLTVTGGGGVLPPSNDDCANRVGVALGNSAFTTVGASTDGPTHVSCGGLVNNDVWFNYPCFATGDLTVSTCGTNFNTKVAVYNNSGCTNFDTRLLACNDDAPGCGTGGSSVTIPVIAGGNYTIRVGGNTAAAVGSGNLNLSLFVPPACAWSAGNCPGDFDNDADFDSDDVSAFFTEWDAGGDCADADQDGDADSDDIAVFFAGWDQGGC